MKALISALCIAGMLTMSACLSPLERHQRGEDTCGLSKTEHLIGQNIDDVDLSSLLGPKYHYRKSDFRRKSWDGLVTADFSPTRQSITINKDGVFILASCT